MTSTAQLAGKLSPAQRRGLLNLRDGLPIGHHLSNRSEYGGFGQTVWWLTKQGLIDADTRLTDRGRAVLAELAGVR